MAVANRWSSRRAIGLHLTLAVVVPTFAVLCVWQVRRALAGNDLSWAYVFEWPFFAAYAVYMWWRLVHEDTAQAPGRQGPGREVPGPEAPGPEGRETRVAAEENARAEEQELADYNRYLAELDASGRRKRW